MKMTSNPKHCLRIAFGKLKLKLAAILLLCATFTHAQFFEQTSKGYDRSLNATVLVVLKYSDSLNNRMRKAFEKYWTATPFQFVTEKYTDTLSAGKNGPSYAVFEGTLLKTINVITSPTGQQSERGTFGNWWSYYLVPLDSRKRPETESIAAWGPINMAAPDWDGAKPFETSFYRVDFIVKQVNDVLEFIRKNKKADLDDYEEWVNKNAPTLKDKTLLIPQELLQPYDLWKVTRDQMEAGVGKVYTSKKPIYKKLVTSEDFANYKGKYKILPAKEIDELASTAGAAQYALFSPALTDRKYIFVFDLLTKEIIYTDQVRASFEVKEKDIKRINEQAGF